MIDKVIEVMENKRGILCVNLTGVEHIGANQNKKLKCKLYEDLGLFVPREMCEVELTEEELGKIIDHFNGLWVLTNSNFTITEVFRYFAVKEPNALNWVRV